MKRILSRCLKGILILITLVGFIFYFIMIPDTIKSMAINFPEFKYLVTPGIITIQISGIPVIIVIVAIWFLCSNITKDQLLCHSNTKYLSIIGYSSMLDIIYCFCFCVYLYTVGAFNPGVFIIFSIIIIIGLTVCFISFLLAQITNDMIHNMKEMILK
jgi:hypothetical protein